MPLSDLYEECLEGLDRLMTPATEAYVMVLRQPGGRIEIRWGNVNDEDARFEATSMIADAFILMDGGDPDEMMN